MGRYVFLQARMRMCAPATDAIENACDKWHFRAIVSHVERTVCASNCLSVLFPYQRVCASSACAGRLASYGLQAQGARL